MPIIIMLCGLPGVGKTTLARQLAPLINGVVLSTDKIRKELFHKPKYRHQEKKLVYNVLILLAKYLYIAGINCILDATFLKQKSRQQVRNKLGKNTKQIYIIECVCPEDIVMARLKSRKLDYSDADFSVYRKMKAMYEPVNEKHITIDTSRFSGVQMKELALKLLDRN
ncbi:MAG: adenylyl-sulfate kinase [Thaumarchaeota archaeon]|nr:MAG: adenylyl-sulfate kinase [Nitrososphaerota archaeon]